MRLTIENTCQNLPATVIVSRVIVEMVPVVFETTRMIVVPGHAIPVAGAVAVTTVAVTPVRAVAVVSISTAVSGVIVMVTDISEPKTEGHAAGLGGTGRKDQSKPQHRNDCQC